MNDEGFQFRVCATALLMLHSFGGMEGLALSKLGHEIAPVDGNTESDQDESRRRLANERAVPYQTRFETSRHTAGQSKTLPRRGPHALRW
jgi:hypothetical protein